MAIIQYKEMNIVMDDKRKQKSPHTIWTSSLYKKLTKHELI